MISKLICAIKGHKTFSYVMHSNYPNEHAYWCGRCGHESSKEADDRELLVQFIIAGRYI